MDKLLERQRASAMLSVWHSPTTEGGEVRMTNRGDFAKDIQFTGYLFMCLKKCGLPIVRLDDDELRIRLRLLVERLSGTDPAYSDKNDEHTEKSVERLLKGILLMYQGRGYGHATEKLETTVDNLKSDLEAERRKNDEMVTRMLLLAEMYPKMRQHLYAYTLGIDEPQPRKRSFLQRLRRR